LRGEIKLNQSQTTIDGIPSNGLSGNEIKNVIQFPQNNTSSNLTVEDSDEYTVIYEATDGRRRVMLPPVDIPPGFKAKISVAKEKIETKHIPQNGNIKIRSEYDDNERILHEYLSLLKEMNVIKERNSELEYVVDQLQDSELLKEHELTNKDQIILNLRKELKTMELNPLRKVIKLTYGYMIPLLALISLVSGLSLIGLHFIPYPIDKALFWSSLAGSFGLYLDYYTKDKKYADS
jgi:hypothetical protein